MGSKSGSSLPAQANPADLVNLQTNANNANALYNFGLNNPNVTTPLGSNTYTFAGNNAQGDPTYNESISLSPAEQGIFDTNVQNVQQQGNIAGTALQGVQNQINQPYNLSGNVTPLLSQTNQQQDLQNAENSLYKQQTQYLDPQYQQGQQQLQDQLAQQGIPQGSQAWNTAMNNFQLQKQQAYQSAMNSANSGGAAYQAQLSQTGLANQAQQAQLYTQQYQEPLNLYNSLISGSQPTMPQFSGTSTSSSAPTNVLGAYQNAYNNSLNAYNTSVGSGNSALSGLFGIGGSLLGNSNVTSGIGSWLAFA